MDHLPAATTKRTLAIDFGMNMTTAEIVIDSGDFLHFLERRQKSRMEAWSAVPDHNHARTSSLLMSWWYFQLLVSQLTMVERTRQENLTKIVTTFTVAQESGSLTLNTSSFVIWLSEIERWRRRSKTWHRDVESHRKELEMSRQIIATGLNDMQSQTRLLSSGQQLAIVLLLEALHHASYFEPLASRGAPDVRNILGHISIPAVEQQVLTALGCMNRVRMSRSRLGWSCLLYVGTLRYLSSHHDHAKCTDIRCTICEVDIKHHHLRHVDHCHGCIDFGPPISLLENLVSDGKTPLVRLDSMCRHNDLELEPLGSAVAYVAISHVWSQLFGHDLGNFLPWCQLQRLQSWASALAPKPTHMWLDILCVPRSQPSLRAAGIAQIKRVIEAADHVLVLDESLIESTFCLRLWEETLVRICISQWMRRLWTLHEAVLATNLSFQFANGPFYFSSLSARNVARDDNLRYNVVGAVALASLQEPMKFCQEPDSATRMARLWNMLRWRSTSWPEQETICLFNMLNAHKNIIEPMSDIPVQLRMEKLLSMYDQFPADLIFMDGPRLDTVGYGWSPSSWLTRGETSKQQRLIDLPISMIGKRTSAGLNVGYAGTCLEYSVNDLIDNWQLHPFISFTDKYHKEKLVQLPDVFGERVQSLHAELAAQQIAIIYDQKPGYQGHLCMQPRVGALVALNAYPGKQIIQSQTQGAMPIQTRFLCIVELMTSERERPEFPENGLSYCTPCIQLDVVYHAEYWCIG